MADVTPKELASAREAAGLYQYQVASLLGVSEYTGGEVMNGYRRQYRSAPRPEAIRGMAMLKCMACTGLAVFAVLAIWIYM